MAEDPRHLSAEVLHWLAGLFEGEGAFLRGSPSAPHRPALVISMIDEDVIARVAALLGVNYFAATPRREHWKVAYAVRLRGAPAVAWMKALRPLLGTRRQGQIDRALATYENRSRRLLDDDAAAEALTLLAGGASVRSVAERFGTSVWCIYDLRLGRTHRHLPRPGGNPAR